MPRSARGPRIPHAERLAPLVRQPSRPPVEIARGLAVAAGIISIVVLGTAAVLNIFWALGGSWGAATVLGDEAARDLEAGEGGTVAGAWVIAGFFVVAALIVLGRMGVLGSRLPNLYRRGTQTLFVVLLVRALLGFVAGAAALGDADEDQALIDILVISPIALALAVLVGIVSLSGLGPGEGRTSEPAGA